MLEIRLLGRFDVRQNGAPVPISTRKGQALLAYLALQPGVAVRREQLAGLLWPDVPEETARANLRQVLWRLRQALGDDALRASDVSLALAAGAWVDTAVLQRSADDDALEAYGGELLPGFYDDWVLPERERLRAIWAHKMAARVAALTAAARWRDVILWAARWLAHEPAAEAAYRALMRAHAGLGEVAQLAAVYQRCVRALAADLGVPPSPQTTALLARLQAAAAAAPHNLPAALTRFFGRETELAALGALLAEPTARLVTLTGAGGSGKTRLALAVAQRAAAAGSFADGVWLVELAALTTADAVVEAVAEAVGTGPGVPPVGEASLPERLAAALQARQLLLLLDNCEHLLPACARLADRLLRRCPHVVLLATSREPLRLPGERLFPVQPLPAPRPHDDLPWLDRFAAVQLFCDRAQAAAPGFALTPRSAPDVARICARLDGMPLALELAAARLALLTPAELAARLDDMLPLLTGGSRAAPPRQQTLQATIDWSISLLDEAERALLRRLAVFQGGATLAAVRAVAAQADALPLLGALVAKSLLLADPSGAETRYRLLEPIRQAAWAQLQASGEAAAVRDRHLAVYHALAETAVARLLTTEQAAWLAVLAAEHANLRAALNWARETAADSAAPLAGAIGIGWYLQAYARQTGADADANRRRRQILDAAALLAAAQGDSVLAQRLQRGDVPTGKGDIR